ncbi:DUF4192 family protein [Kocuria sp.]|uniref:DUF4192 family protein n=1 Tax=Kocuria sp. TaxID=1871328 RepID=UPI0026DEF8DA|nr:DUF4192 family protein [Kocuria sp.]MDO5619380.1 DUF4192 family protein [Kocuria sp.]
MARTAADVLAILPHTLGFWPQHSVAVITTTSNSVGPCLRLELPTLEELADQQFLLSWITQMREILEYDTVGTSMFIAVYGAAPEAGYHSAREREQAQALAEVVTQAVTKAGGLSGHEVQDAWCLQGAQWWPVEEPRDLHDVAKIRNSSMYAALVCDGSVVEEDPAAWANSPSMQSAWTDQHPEHDWTDCSWRLSFLEQWQATITSVERGAPTTAGTSRELTELLLAVVDPIGADLVLAMALTGEMEASSTAWVQWQAASQGEKSQAKTPLPTADSPSSSQDCQYPAEYADCHELLHVAQVMLGEWQGTPDWDSVDRCAIVLEHLSLTVDSLSAPGTASPLPTMEASLWIARAHLERFRARGSRAEYCLSRAEAVAPWHPGIQRLRQLFATRPVPVWASRRDTAWRR